MADVKDKKEISLLFEAFPPEWKVELPVAFYGARGNPTRHGVVTVVKSKAYNTEQLACFWFYKPITQMHKSY